MHEANPEQGRSGSAPGDDAVKSEALGFTADVDRKVLSDSGAPARPHAQPTRREVDRVGLEDGGRGTSPSRQRKIDSSGLSWVVACFRVHSMTGV